MTALVSSLFNLFCFFCGLTFAESMHCCCVQACSRTVTRRTKGTESRFCSETQTAHLHSFFCLMILRCLNLQGARAEASPGLRSLSLDDFIQSKAKVIQLHQCQETRCILILLRFALSMIDINHKDVIIVIICMGDVILQVSPSVAYDATTMNELRKWNEQYGEGGSRTKSPFGF